MIRARDASKGHLEGDVDVLGDDDAVREGFDIGIGVDAGQESFREAADEAVECATFGESEAVAVGHPDDADDGNAVENLHQHRQHVLRADETA